MMMKMMATMMAIMIVMTIAIKMTTRIRRNKLMNTFSRRLEFVFVSVIVKNVYVYCSYTSRMSQWFSLFRKTVQPLNNIHLQQILIYVLWFLDSLLHLKNWGNNYNNNSSVAVALLYNYARFLPFRKFKALLRNSAITSGPPFFTQPPNPPTPLR